MPKHKISAPLRTLPCGIGLSTVNRTTFSGAKPDVVPCPASPSAQCTSVSCAKCRFVPTGVWACITCATALCDVARVLPFHGDTPCHYCGASPLLTLRLEVIK